MAASSEGHDVFHFTAPSNRPKLATSPALPSPPYGTFCMALDTRYLLLRHLSWSCAVEVPPSLRHLLGKRLVRSLRTHDIAIARIRRWAVVAEFKGKIADARKSRSGDPIDVEAMEARAALQETDRAGDDYTSAIHRDLIAERAEALARTVGEPAALRYVGLATGAITPLMEHVEAWIKGSGVGAKTARERERQLERLRDYLAAEGLPVTVEAVTRRVAQRYAAHLGESLEGATVAKVVQGPRGYWEWMDRAEKIAEGANPWVRAGRGEGRRKSGRKRAFTEAEARLLLYGTTAVRPSPVLSDMILLAAGSGMRREEIGQLEVGDCQDGVFRVRAAKTQAGIRAVPIHPALASVVARLIGSRTTGYLVADLAGSPSRRTMNIGKTFIAYRRALGVEEGRGRQSNIDFHSWRRRFVTEALNAGIEPRVVAVVVGHELPEGETQRTYWSGPTDAQRRACVEAVKMPPPP